MAAHHPTLEGWGGGGHSISGSSRCDSKLPRADILCHRLHFLLNSPRTLMAAQQPPRRGPGRRTPTVSPRFGSKQATACIDADVQLCIRRLIVMTQVRLLRVASLDSTSNCKRPAQRRRVQWQRCTCWRPASGG